ncbi:hypothetical protein K0817_013765 [Microbacterium sp. HD4P20]|uniref:hypothetical protein n=1 Tax=Microbacterium sp. HD4P20 TaxID=2864874 RepID=UPI001C641F34|nr:hypothetical protein [Microbacterium sp. HD4P20]MCP2637621.1 hypothetical protein [Microbacterium sp. HD4P20]
MTTRHQLVVNGHTYPLADDDRLTDTKRAILTAVHDGGAFVEVRAGAVTTAEVLVTPATSIIIEHIDIPDNGQFELRELETVRSDSGHDDETDLWM